MVVDQMHSTSMAEQLEQSPEQEEMETTIHKHLADYLLPDRVVAQVVVVLLCRVVQEATEDFHQAAVAVVEPLKPEHRQGREEQAEQASQL
jgi:hypothetical protein